MTDQARVAREHAAALVALRQIADAAALQLDDDSYLQVVTADGTIIPIAWTPMSRCWRNGWITGDNIARVEVTAEGRKALSKNGRGGAPP